MKSLSGSKNLRERAAGGLCTLQVALKRADRPHDKTWVQPEGLQAPVRPEFGGLNAMDRCQPFPCIMMAEL